MSIFTYQLSHPTLYPLFPLQLRIPVFLLSWPSHSVEVPLSHLLSSWTPEALEIHRIYIFTSLVNHGESFFTIRQITWTSHRSSAGVCHLWPWHSPDNFLYLAQEWAHTLHIRIYLIILLSHDTNYGTRCLHMRWLLITWYIWQDTSDRYLWRPSDPPVSAICNSYRWLANPKTSLTTDLILCNEPSKSVTLNLTWDLFTLHGHFPISHRTFHRLQAWIWVASLQPTGVRHLQFWPPARKFSKLTHIQFNTLYTCS